MAELAMDLLFASVKNGIAVDILEVVAGLVAKSIENPRSRDGSFLLQLIVVVDDVVAGHRGYDGGDTNLLPLPLK